MVQLSVNMAKAVGTAKQNSWSQVHSVKSGVGESFILLSLKYIGESDLVDLPQIGMGIIESWVNNRESVDKIISQLDSEIKLTILIVEKINDKLVIKGKGEAEVYLRRLGKIGKIFSSTQDFRIINGVTNLDDRVILTTIAISKLIGIKGITKILEIGTTEIENLAVMIHKQDDSSEMAILMMESEIKPNLSIANTEMPPLNRWTNLLQRIGWQKPLMITQEKKKKNATIGLILLALLMLGVGMGMIKRTKLIKEAQYSQLSSSVSQKIDEAKSIGDLNPERAKVLILEVKQEIESYLKEVEDEKYKEKANNLEKTLRETETAIFKKQDVAINTFVELKIFDGGLKANKMFVDDQNNVLFSDQDNLRVVGMSLRDKSQFTYKTDEIGKISELGIANKKIYGITDKGIAIISGTEKKIVIEPDELWKEITLIDTYGESIYLFDRGQSEIWKYPALTEGFGTRKRWLGAGISLDLSNVVDMKVDGDIWLITTTGKLERYSRGVPVIFGMEGLPIAEGVSATAKLSQPSAIFLTDTKVYVLESGPGRVVVLDKESGKYERQYVSEVMKEGKDLVVSEDKGYVLLNDKIVWFQL